MPPAAPALLSLAFDPAVETPEDPASGQVLDAALALAAASGIRNLTMDDVAERARVGRMTVYRRFGSKQRLVEALAVRECRRCLAEIDRADDPSLPPDERTAEGFVAALRVAREHPLLNRLARVEPETVLASLTADEGFLFGVLRAFLAQRIRASQAEGAIGAFDPEEAAEILVRLGISYVLLQESVVPLDDDDAARDLARRMIAPILTAPSA